MNLKIFVLLILILVLILRFFTTGLTFTQLSKVSYKDDIYLGSIEDQAYILREKLTTKLQQLYPPPFSALLNGILFGVKSDLSPELKKSLINSSTIHIAVVSGQNLTLLCGFILILRRYLGLKFCLLVSLLFASGYMILTGAEIPVIRAFIFVSLGYLAQLLGREKDTIWILIITGLVMLILKPTWIYSISFQLSFLATVAVTIVGPAFVNFLNFIPRIIREDLAISFAAQLLTLPIIASNFHHLSLVGVLANCLVLWTITPIMVLGGISVILSWISLLLARILVIVNIGFLGFFLFVIENLGRLTLAQIYVPNFSFSFWVGYYVLLIGLLWQLKVFNFPQGQIFKKE